MGHPAAGEASPGQSRAGARYRFTRLRLGDLLRDMRFAATDLAPGDQVAAFDLETLDGGRFRSADLARTGPVVLVFGSVTCPVTESAIPGLRELHRAFGLHARFVLVAVREAHPGGLFPQPTTAAAKRGHAELFRTQHGIQFEIAVDDLDGTLHRAFGTKPNSAYIISTGGYILFRAHWANDTEAIRRALAQLAHGRRPNPSESSGLLEMGRRMLPHLAVTLNRAGPGAWRDLWRVAPPMALAGMLTGAALRLRSPSRSGSAATPLGFQAVPRSAVVDRSAGPRPTTATGTTQDSSK